MPGLEESKWNTNPLVLRTLRAASFPDPPPALESCALQSYSCRKQYFQNDGLPQKTPRKLAAP